jgi:hypothetical protein
LFYRCHHAPSFYFKHTISSYYYVLVLKLALCLLCPLFWEMAEKISPCPQPQFRLTS